MNETTPIFLEEHLKLHPADLADCLQRLDADEARALLRRLPANGILSVKGCHAGNG
jgi:hypothetical protein